MRGEDVHGALVIKDIYVACSRRRHSARALPRLRRAVAILRRRIVRRCLPSDACARLGRGSSSSCSARSRSSPCCWVDRDRGSTTVEAARARAIVATVYAWARNELTWTRGGTVRTVMRLTGMMFLC